MCTPAATRASARCRGERAACMWRSRDADVAGMLHGAAGWRQVHWWRGRQERSAPAADARSRRTRTNALLPSCSYFCGGALADGIEHRDVLSSTHLASLLRMLARPPGPLRTMVLRTAMRLPAGPRLTAAAQAEASAAAKAEAAAGGITLTLEGEEEERRRRRRTTRSGQRLGRRARRAAAGAGSICRSWSSEHTCTATPGWVRAPAAASWR